jgi:hypothetical protein
VTTLNHNLCSGPHQRPQEQVGDRAGGQAVPAADFVPGFWARRDVDADWVNGKAEQESKEHGCERCRRAATVEAAGVAEDDDPDAFFGSQRHRRMEARQDAGLANRPVVRLLTELERQTHTRHTWIRLEVRSEHDCHGLGPQHRAVPVTGPAQKRRDVTSDVRRGGVHTAPARGRDFAVGDLLEAAGAQHIPGGKVRSDPFRTG